jgi:hypothetical protein
MSSSIERTRVPSYRRHKPSGQAVVTLNGKDRYLVLVGKMVIQRRRMGETGPEAERRCAK